jgi:inositol oxygenase
VGAYETMRDYDASTDRVRETYRRNHRFQTYEFARTRAEDFGAGGRAHMSMWSALMELDRVIDDSDPDTELSQLEHALQTAESLRGAAAPEWLQLVGLIHDAGKMLCLFGEEQWAVVGDTFPLGCAFDPSIVFHEFFEENPDRRVEAYSTREGIYREGCGLDTVTMSWGHDEYLFRVLRGRLPTEAAFVIRYHSFYPLHQHGAYRWMLDDEDRRLASWLPIFQKHDLYSKSEDRPDFAPLREHYHALCQKWLPDELDW